MQAKIATTMAFSSTANHSDLIASESAGQPVARLAWLIVIYNIVVILWGAYVRATGSGTGCGSHWPLCNGNLVPVAPQLQTIIEYVHRVTSGAAVVVSSLFVAWCWRKTSKADWPRYSAVLALMLLLNEALLGALLVRFDHVGFEKSPWRALFLCLHFANTLLLLATLSLTAQWLSTGQRRFTIRLKPLEWIPMAFGLISFAAIGVSGSLAALGDGIFPSASLRLSIIQDFSSRSNALLHLRLLHPILAVIGASFVFWAVPKLSEQRGHSKGILRALTFVLSAQVIMGGLNVLLLAPIWLQITHLFIAEVLWILIVLASSSVLLESLNSAQV